MEEQKKKLTTASGRPFAENENTQTVGPRGPILLQDYILHEKMEDGNWDLAGNNTPVFFVKDPKKFGDFIHTQNYATGSAPTSDWAWPKD